MYENVFLISVFVTTIILFILLRIIISKINKSNNVKPIITIIINVLIFLFFASFIVVCGECYYRYIYDDTDALGLTKTTKHWFSKHYKFNSLNIRDNNNDYNFKSDNRIRITFLGDSFTAGHGIKNVDDRFVNIIRKQLPNVQVHTFAMNGVDTGEELLQIQSLIDNKYDFGLVVLVYNLNDISDISIEWSSFIQRVFIEATPGFLVTNSYFINFLYYRVLAAHDPQISKYYQVVMDGYQGNMWEIQKNRLLKINSLIKNSGGKLVVVTFPFMHEIGLNYSYSTIHSQLHELWTGDGVQHLDLLECFDGHKKNELMVNANDPHPNEYAHLLAAQKMIPFLLKNIR